MQLKDEARKTRTCKIQLIYDLKMNATAKHIHKCRFTSLYANKHLVHVVRNANFS